MSNNEQSNKTISFNWGSGIMVAIILFIITTLSVVAYLVSLDYHVVAENYYEKAEKYQQHIDRVEQASAMDQPVEITLAADKRSLTITFPSSVSVDDITGSIKLYRPSDSSLDRNLKLALNTNHTQHIETKRLIAGKWIVKLQWSSDNEKYYTQKDIFL